MSNTIKLVHNEEQEVEVYFNEDCIFYWTKDTDGYDIRDYLENLLETLNQEYICIESSKFYAEDDSND